MTTVDITSTPIEDYTWDTATFDWTDARAGKAWDEAYISSFGLDVGETLGLAEVLGKALTKSVSENFSVTEALRKDIGVIPQETLSIAENYVDYIAFMIRAFESLAVSEGMGFESVIPVFETFSVAETMFQKTIGFSPYETILFAEALMKAGQVAVAESFGVTEQISKDLTLVENEAFALSESLSKQFGLTNDELFSFAETFGRVVAYRKAISETLTVTEALSKAFGLSEFEAFTLFEEYVRRANAVISDMVIGTGDISLVDFKNIVDSGKAPGYSAFRDFAQGDYEYQYGIFRAVLESTNAFRARLAELKLTIDVPDVTDRGSAVITDALAGVYVEFNREFHVVPEIIMTLTGGTVVAIPDAIDKSMTGFTAILTNTSGTRVTGTVSWSAHGY